MSSFLYAIMEHFPFFVYTCNLAMHWWHEMLLLENVTFLCRMILFHTTLHLYDVFFFVFAVFMVIWNQLQ